MSVGDELAVWCARAYGSQETPLKIAAIISYEAGDLVRDMVRVEDYPDMAETYEAMGRTSLGDVLAMGQQFCTLKGWEFQAVYRDGCARAIDRAKEKLEGKAGF